jgi:hypothetical protein
MPDATIEKTKGTEVAEVLARGLKDYDHQYGPLPYSAWKVVNALQRCRTAAMGGHTYKCESCDYEKHVYNSCRNRHCPKCQGMARLKWVQNRMEELLPVNYFHAVFTIPCELNVFALRNKETFYDLLQKSVAETLQELARDPKRLGAEIGFISVLHTWGQNMMDHPHVHCIVPAGGLKSGKRWRGCKGEFLFPFKVMSGLFKGKLMSAFKKAVAKGNIRFHGQLAEYADPSHWQAFLESLYAKNWVTYCKPPFAGAGQVLKYLGGYTHRIAISNHRITHLGENSVSFKWRSYADEGQTRRMTLSHVEFIRRFLLHVLPKGYQRIRYYGFLANCKRKQALARCFEILQAKYKSAKTALKEKSVVTERGLLELLKKVYNIDLALCPQCRQSTLRPVFSGVRYTSGVF